MLLGSCVIQQHANVKCKVLLVIIQIFAEHETFYEPNNFCSVS